MKCKLTPGLSSGDWNEFCSRFHFPPDDLPHIQAIYTALLPLVESYAYYSLAQDLDGVSLPHYAYGFVTLGNGVDELSELYLNHEQIQEAYIVDCISLMLLSKAYEEFAHVVERQSRPAHLRGSCSSILRTLLRGRTHHILCILRINTCAVAFF